MDNCESCAELLQEECEGVIGVCPESPVVRDYNAFTNKPSINGVTLVGDKTSDDLGITQQITEAVQAEAEARQNADEALQQDIDDEETARTNADAALGDRITANATAINNEALARQNADNGLQTQIDAITSQSDVVDVVANYAALQAYDTSSLSDNDVIKVLDDETHEDALTYYRWSTATQTWSYIGQEAPYYSKGQMDVMLQGKQDTLTAGANIQIENGTISATDTKYTAGNGLNLNGTEFSADTDTLATKEDLEGYYTKPETDNLLAPKLEAEVVAELPATGEEGKLYLTPKAHTTQTATGNPITATVAEDAGKIESFQLDGDTFQQTYTGKNLANTFDMVEATNSGLTVTKGSDGAIILNGTQTAACNIRINETEYFSGLVGEDLTISVSTSGTGAWNNFGIKTPNASIITPATPTNPTITRTLTASSSGGYWLDLYIANSGTVFTDFKLYLQVEKGSTATSFEPYVGGIPSPNPDYPQPIQTVTGLQTISINGTDYTLDLGNIELNGLGDDGAGGFLYKDRIYRDGNDWKIHKATGSRTFDGSEQWTYDSVRVPRIYLSENALNNLGIHPVIPSGNGAQPIGKLTKFTAKTFLDFYTNGQGDGFAMSTAGRNFQVGDNRWTSRDDALAATIGARWYYAQATGYETDTVITDTTLIAQLEAIRTASLQNGANTITNTATGSNLAGDMEIGYYGFAPRNRYDKWLWLDINNEYEQIGS